MANSKVYDLCPEMQLEYEGYIFKTVEIKFNEGLSSIDSVILNSICNKTVTLSEGGSVVETDEEVLKKHYKKITNDVDFILKIILREV
jgi:hypothetical protein